MKRLLLIAALILIGALSDATPSMKLDNVVDLSEIAMLALRQASVKPLTQDERVEMLRLAGRLTRPKAEQDPVLYLYYEEMMRPIKDEMRGY